MVRQIDGFVARRSGAEKIPALLLVRQAGGDERAVGHLVRDYANRLVRPARGRGNSLYYVPHALVEDGLAGGDPFTEAIDHIAFRFERTRPAGSGDLRLSAFHTCRAVLDLERGSGTASAQQDVILAGLYERLLTRRKSLRLGSLLAGLFGKSVLTGWMQGFVEAFVVRLPKAVYGIWLRRFGLRWVADELKAVHFLDAALEFCQDGDLGQADPLTRRVLLRALVTDLHRATRRRWPLSYRWSRRRWAFVVLLPEICDLNGSSRTFLGVFEELTQDVPSHALLILAAVTGEPPVYAVPLDADLTRPNGVADGVFHVLAEGSADQVCLVTLPAADDNADGTAARRLATHSTVEPRSNSLLDLLRPASPLIIAALLATGLYVKNQTTHLPPPPAPPSCIKVATGELVGMTDGLTCSLAVPGSRGDELRALEKVVGDANQKIVGQRYRSLVFLAPLSLQDGVYDSPPLGLQILRGAIAQQQKLNGENRKDKMPIRLLIANTGQYFRYGALNQGGPDVAQMIIDRQRKEGVAAVIGLTQSRPESLAAAKELDKAEIPVIATGVTGSIMVGPDSPHRYFQISPPNQRVAPVMAAFLRDSPEIRKLTGAPPAAVVVWDPDDTYFSVDLKNKFQKAYGKVDEVHYNEKSGGTDSGTIATEICRKTATEHGVVVYLGRSGVMPDLLNAMNGVGGACQPKKGTVPVLAESVPIDFQTEPKKLAERYPYLTIFYSTSNSPSGDSRDPYAQFTRSFAEAFGTLSADSDAAGGFDTVGIVAKVIESLLPAYRNADFQPNDVYLWLTAHGVSQYPGASGVLKLDSQNKFPPDKALYIREVTQPSGRVGTPLSCGILPDQSNPARWGVGSMTFICPRD